MRCVDIVIGGNAAEVVAVVVQYVCRSEAASIQAITIKCMWRYHGMHIIITIIIIIIIIMKH